MSSGGSIAQKFADGDEHAGATFEPRIQGLEIQHPVPRRRIATADP